MSGQAKGYEVIGARRRGRGDQISPARSRRPVLASAAARSVRSREPSYRVELRAGGMSHGIRIGSSTAVDRPDIDRDDVRGAQRPGWLAVLSCGRDTEPRSSLPSSGNCQTRHCRAKKLRHRPRSHLPPPARTAGSRA
jgi:hypothetical protein